MPSLTFAFTGDAVPAARGARRVMDESGAVIEHEGELHMFANVFSQWPGHVAFPHLVSRDGATWTKAASSPAFTSDDIPYVESGADVSAGYVAADGTWVLVFEAVELSDLRGSSAVPPPRARAAWTIDRADPPPGPTGSWDSGGLQWPSVVGPTRLPDVLHRPGSPRRARSIGLATSPDGSTWAKHEGPVLTAELDWERGQVDRPRVADTPRGLAMVYAGRLTDRSRRGPRTGSRGSATGSCR